jgi:hypothetical protein
MCFYKVTTVMLLKGLCHASRYCLVSDHLLQIDSGPHRITQCVVKTVAMILLLQVFGL